MKVALLTDGIYPYVIGGMQKHSFLLAKYLARNKVYVDLYHTNQSAFDITKLELFSQEEKQYIRSFVVEFPDLGKMPGHYVRESYEYSIRVFKEFSKNQDVDFVYAKGFSAWKLLDEKRKGFKCAPVGVNFHGYEMFQNAATFKTWLEQVLLLRRPVLFNINQSDHVFSYGGKITEIILGLGIDRKRIIEIPAGIEEDWLVNEVKVPEKVRKFVFVGRYERRKGVEELSAALKKLIVDQEMEFHFIGFIPENKKIISEKVIYHGVVTDSDKMKSLLRSCDVLVCPSYSEGMPNVILEAMASGLAIIATDVGAVNLMVSGSNGWLISSMANEVLDSVLLKAIRISENDLLLMKTRSLEIVKKEFVWSKLITDLIQKLALLN